jgi:hypothetical protein
MLCEETHNYVAVENHCWGQKGRPSVPRPGASTNRGLASEDHHKRLGSCPMLSVAAGADLPTQGAGPGGGDANRQVPGGQYPVLKYPVGKYPQPVVTKG